MSIAKDLRYYLVNGDDLPGHAAREFIRPQIVGSYTCNNRNDARGFLRSIVGNHVYRDRRPQDAGIHSALEIRTLSDQKEYGVQGEEQTRREFVTVRCVSRGENTGDRCDVMADLLLLATSGWSGGMWGERYVCECLADSEDTRSTPLVDGSDRHAFTRDVDLNILHESPAPVYPAVPLQVRIVFQSVSGDDTLRLAAQTQLPENATLVDVDWDIKETSTGPTLITFNGEPDTPVTEPNVTGTYRQPAIDRAAIGLAGPAYVTCTVTDSLGDFASDTNTEGD